MRPNPEQPSTENVQSAATQSASLNLNEVQQKVTSDPLGPFLDLIQSLQKNVEETKRAMDVASANQAKSQQIVEKYKENDRNLTALKENLNKFNQIQKYYEELTDLTDQKTHYSRTIGEKATIISEVETHIATIKAKHDQYIDLILNEFLKTISSPFSETIFSKTKSLFLGEIASVNQIFLDHAEAQAQKQLSNATDEEEFEEGREEGDEEIIEESQRSGLAEDLEEEDQEPVQKRGHVQEHGPEQGAQPEENPAQDLSTAFFRQLEESLATEIHHQKKTRLKELVKTHIESYRKHRASTQHNFYADILGSNNSDDHTINSLENEMIQIANNVIDGKARGHIGKFSKLLIEIGDEIQSLQTRNPQHNSHLKMMGKAIFEAPSPTIESEQPLSLTTAASGNSQRQTAAKMLLQAQKLQKDFIKQHINDINEALQMYQHSSETLKAFKGKFDTFMGEYSKTIQALKQLAKATNTEKELAEEKLKIVTTKISTIKETIDAIKPAELIETISQQCNLMNAVHTEGSETQPLLSPVLSETIKKHTVDNLQASAAPDASQESGSTAITAVITQLDQQITQNNETTKKKDSDMHQASTTLTENANNHQKAAEKLNATNTRVNAIVNEIHTLANTVLLDQKRFLKLIDGLSPSDLKSTINKLPENQKPKDIPALKQMIKNEFLETTDTLHGILTTKFMPKNVEEQSAEHQDHETTLKEGFLEVCNTLQSLPVPVQEALLASVSENVLLKQDLSQILEDANAADNLKAFANTTLQKLNTDLLTSLESFNPYAWNNTKNTALRRLTDPLGTHLDANAAKSVNNFGSAYVDLLFQKTKQTAEETKLLHELRALQDLDLTQYSDLKKVLSLSENNPILALKALKNESLDYIAKLDGGLEKIALEIKLLESTAGSISQTSGSKQVSNENEYTVLDKWDHMTQLNRLQEQLQDRKKDIEARKDLCKNYLKTLEEETPALVCDGDAPVKSGILPEITALTTGENPYHQRFSKHKTGDQPGIYIVSTTKRLAPHELDALKLLTDEANPHNLMICDAADAPLLSLKEKTDHFRVVKDLAPQDNQGKAEVINIYSEAIDAHAQFLTAIKNTEFHEGKPVNAIDTPKNPPPTAIYIHPQGTNKFKHVHSMITDYPDKMHYTKNAPQGKDQLSEYKKTRVHASLQLAKNDLEKRIGDLQNPNAIKEHLKKMTLVVHTKDVEKARDLCTAYLITLEHKYGLSQKEALKMLSISGLTPKQFNLQSLYKRSGITSECKKYFNDKDIRASYNINKTSTKETNAALKSLFLRGKQPMEDQDKATAVVPPAGRNINNPH